VGHSRGPSRAHVSRETSGNIKAVKMVERRLGRGLELLIPASSERQDDAICQIPLSQIQKNRFQPREDFNKEKIEELAESIKQNGIIQPIIVRKKNGAFELIAGERRYLASQILKLETIPAIVQDVSDDQLLELALVENLQREDLNPIEEAHAIQMMVKYKGLTHEEISNKIGKHRTYVTNILRLLDLPQKIQDAVSRGTIKFGHARALLGLPSPKEILAAFEVIVQKNLSVRETEALVKKASSPKPGDKLASKNLQKSSKSPHVFDLENRLREIYNTRVSIDLKGYKGRVSFSFYSQDDLGRLFDRLSSCRTNSVSPNQHDGAME